MASPPEHPYPPRIWTCYQSYQALPDLWEDGTGVLLLEVMRKYLELVLCSVAQLHPSIPRKTAFALTGDQEAEETELSLGVHHGV